jgi:hypothetical protein
MQEDFSFLVTSDDFLPTTALAAHTNSPDLLGFMGVVDAADQPPATVKDTVNLNEPIVGSFQVLRTYQDWTRRVKALKAARDLAWKLWIAERDKSDIDHVKKWGAMASAEQIAQAKADIKTLNAKIAIARAQLDACIWCPWLDVPDLKCHVVDVRPWVKRQSRRLWTLRKKNNYRRSEVRELEECLRQALAGSKRLDLASFQPDLVQEKIVVDALSNYERLKKELEVVEIGFEKFKSQGPPPETIDEEIARRVAMLQAQADCIGGAGALSTGGAAAAWSSGAGSLGAQTSIETNYQQAERAEKPTNRRRTGQIF